MIDKPLTSKQVNPPNPTGVGGFSDNPQNRNNGRWNKEESISYQYNKLIRMTSEDMSNWLANNPESVRTVAQEIAYNAVVKAKKDYKYLVEVTNRTEGMSPQTIDLDDSRGSNIDPAVLLSILTDIKDAKPRDNNS